MKKIKLLFAFATIITVLFSACKKDDKTPAKTTLQKLQAKWTFQKEYYHEIYSGNESRDTTIGSAGDYIDFRTDNKAYFNISGLFHDTAAYSLLSDTKLVLTFQDNGFPYSDTAEIQTLTDNALTIYVKETYPAPSTDYDEFWDYLVK